MVNLKTIYIMNTHIKSLVIACISMLSFACTTFEEESLAVNTDSSEITITAIREDAQDTSRTTLKSDGSVEWCPKEEISIFYHNATNGGNRFTSQNTEQTAIAEFRGKINGISAGGENFTDGKYLYGVYPYSPSTTFNDGIVTLSLPIHQTAIEGTFANGLFPTIARSQSVNLAFYNICGGVKFSVAREDITSVTFKGNNNEKIAGQAKIAFDNSGIPYVMDEEVDSKGEITVYAPAGGTFEVGKEYYIVAYPTKLTSGYTLTFRTADQKEGVYTTNGEVEIKRSIFGVINQADANVTSWTDFIFEGGGDSNGIYLGVMGFNQNIYSYPINALSSDNKVGFDSFIDDLNMKNGTLLYYSVDQALNTMQTTQLPDDLSTAAIVTFTDGLDQGSVMMNSTYQDNTTYLNALNNRIKNEKIGGQSITAYSIGIRGQDVSDVTTFRNNLKKLASSDANATEVTSMAEVNAKFREIAAQLSRSNYVQTINLTIPGVSNGTLIRFTFDNVNSANKSTLYIEGTFNLETRSLENVKYQGLTSTSGTEIKGVVDGIFVTFTFEGVQTEDNVLIDNQFTDEWTYISSNNTWQINSEFDKTENSDIVTERNSAVIMLVLDCSSSLADDFVKAQTNAKDFINTLYEAVGGEDDSEQNPTNNLIYSTMPKDLTLAIWKDSVRYYLTKAEFDKANLSGAVVEGLTIVSGGESFILSLSRVQTDPISSINWVDSLYKDLLPTANQGFVISAKWSDINSAMSSFGGVKMSSSYYYYTSSTTSSSNYSFTHCISGSGGNLYNTNSSPYVIGAKSTDHPSPIYWTDPNDLKLSVLINGERVFLNNQEYEERKDEVATIEGVAVIAGGEKFAVHLYNAQTDYIANKDTAKTLYGDIIPTGKQGWIISTKWSDINSAISSFGGAKMSSSYYYYTTYTYTKSNSNYSYPYCINYYGGKLYNTNSYPYVRGVTNLE